MTLYCRSCNDLHAFDQASAERLIYCLQAMLSDEVTDKVDRLPVHTTEHFECLLDVLKWSQCQEMYAEYVQAEVEIRLVRREAKVEWREEVLDFRGIVIYLDQQAPPVDNTRFEYFEVWTEDDQERQGTFGDIESAVSHGEYIRRSGYLEEIAE